MSALCGDSTHDLAVARKRGNTVLEASAAAIEEADKRCILVAAAIDKCNYLFGGDCGDCSVVILAVLRKCVHERVRDRTVAGECIAENMSAGAVTITAIRAELYKAGTEQSAHSSHCGA